MPDSLPPDDEGPDPYEGQDLDGLLSGDSRDVPEELLKVIPALDALRAAPRGPELSGEAAVRADFREIMLGGRSGLAFPDPDADDALTRILPLDASPVEPHVVRRRPHSHRRPRPRQRGRWQPKAVVGAAAAAVLVVGATAFAATLSRPGPDPVAGRLNPGVTSPAAASTAPGSHAVAGTGTPEATGTPSATATQSGSSPSPAELCREYFTYLANPRHHGNSLTESELYRMLSSLASGQDGGVNSYCTRRLQPWEAQQGSGNSRGMAGPFSGNGQGQPGIPVPKGDQAGNGASGSGANGNSQSSNSSGSGPGNQGPP